MTIDLQRENPVSFGKLARSLPRRSDKPVAPSTVHRWRLHGIQGIRLEAIKIGGTWHTTDEAFQRFCEKLTAQADATPVPYSPASKSFIASPVKNEDERNGNRNNWPS